LNSDWLDSLGDLSSNKQASLKRRLNLRLLP